MFVVAAGSASPVLRAVLPRAAALQVQPRSARPERRVAQAQRTPFLSRRAVVGLAAAAPLPAAAVFEKQLEDLSLAFDGGPGEKELLKLQLARSDLQELARKLQTEELRDGKDDGVIVLRTLAAQLSGIPSVVETAAESMPSLREKQSKARALAEDFAKEFKAIRQGARDGEAAAQLRGTEGALRALDNLLALAATKYKLPELPQAGTPFSKDPEQFAAQYFGFLSCEGQGVERIKGSNTCSDKKLKKK
jgi:hypothetical protein